MVPQVPAWLPASPPLLPQTAHSSTSFTLQPPSSNRTTMPGCEIPPISERSSRASELWKEDRLAAKEIPEAWMSSSLLGSLQISADPSLRGLPSHQAHSLAALWGAGLAPTSLPGSPLLTLRSTISNSQLLSQDTGQPLLSTTA